MRTTKKGKAALDLSLHFGTDVKSVWQFEGNNAFVGSPPWCWPWDLRAGHGTRAPAPHDAQQLQGN